MKEARSWVPVAYAYNSRYLVDEDQEDHNLRPTLGKTSVKPHLNQQLGTVVCACQPSYVGG
jgi:hypothetical protein